MRHHRFTNICGHAVVVGSQSGGEFESALERDRLRSLIPQPDIRCVLLQQPQIQYVGLSGDPTRYTADMLVEFKLSARRRPLVIETKYCSEIEIQSGDTLRKREEKDQLNRKHALLTKEFDRLGKDFEVHTEKDVYAPKMRMCRFVFDYVNTPYDESEAEILRVMDQLRECTLGSLLKRMRPDDLTEQLYLVPSIWKLVARHHIRTDFSQLLNDSAVLTAAP